MSWVQAVQSKLPGLGGVPGLPGLPRPEGRSEGQIDRDLEDEFAFHVNCVAGELMKDGVDGEEARRKASARFGDVESIKRECRRIALRERIMLQRVNFVMMIVVLVLLIGMGVQMVLMQRHNAMSLEAIKAHLAITKSGPGPSEAAGSGGASVMVTGDVERPGWYSIKLTGDGTLLKDVLDRAGIGDEKRVVLIKRPGDERRTSVTEQERGKYVLVPGMEILVPVPKQASGAGEPMWDGLPDVTAMWKQVDDQGAEVEGGATLEIISTSDVRNVRSEPVGTLRLPNSTTSLALVFQSAQRGANLYITSNADKGKTFQGRWSVRDGATPTLTLFIAPAVGEFKEPISFVRESSGVHPVAESSANSGLESPGYVYADGLIARPGVYGLPREGRLTLGRFIAAAGGVAEGKEIRVRVTSLNPERQLATHQILYKDLPSDVNLDYVLAAGDVVLLEEVEALPEIELEVTPRVGEG